MAVKRQKKAPSKSGKTPLALGFLFIGAASKETMDLLNDSVKQIRKEYQDNSAFFYLDKPGYEDDPGLIREATGEENKLPQELEKFDYTIVLPAGRINKKLNLNAFFSLEKDKLPDSVEYSRLLFQDMSISPVISYVLGSETLQYLRTLPFHSKGKFRRQLEWYLERLNAQAKDVFIAEDAPFGPGKTNFTDWFSFLSVKRSLKWNFSIALKEQRMNTGFRPGREKPAWRTAFFIASVLVLIILPLLSYNAGISGDEEKHHLHAIKVYDYFKTDGADTLALNDPKYKLNYYGQSFDLFAYLFIRTFNIEKVYEARHVLNGVAGALAIITSAILIRYLVGNFAAFLTLLFMFFFPRFMGHSMNNPMDIPFALGYIFSIYQMVRFLRKLPEFSLKHAILLTIGIGFTTSVRIGGLILIPYLFMFSGLYLIFKKWPWKFFSTGFNSFAGKGILYLVSISVISYFLMILPWPYAIQDPLKNPFEALAMMSNITVALRVLFEGDIIWSDSLPWNYVPQNMWITIPVMIWLLFGGTLAYFFKKKPAIPHFWLFTLYFITIFPVIYIIYRESNVYGGWRHTLFIYPGFAGIAAIGANGLKNLSRSKIYRSVVVTVLILGLYHPVSHTLRNYPLQYIYFNEITGGVDGAYTKYENDYYLNSLKPATDWILKNVVDETDEKITIISNAPYDIMYYYYRDYLDQINFPYTRYYERGAHDWDYAVFYCNYIDPYQLRRNIWPPKNTIHEIKVDDVTVCAIVKREDRSDYHGIQAMNEGLTSRDINKISSGINLLEQAIQYDKNNEIAMLSLARGYITVQEYDRARNVLGSLLEVYPDYDKALNLLAFSYISEGDMKKDMAMIDRAINILTKLLNVNYKFSDGYYHLGLAYFFKGDDNRALSYLNQALEFSANQKKAYYLMATIFERNGDTERARQVLDYVNSL